MSALGSSLVTGLAEIKYSSADILPALEHLSVLDRCIIPAAVDPEKSRHTGSGPAEEISGTVDGLEFVFDNIANGIDMMPMDDAMDGQPKAGEWIYDTNGRAYRYSSSIDTGIYITKGGRKIVIQ